MEVTGIIKEIFATQTISDKFKKRDFVLTTEANTPYPQHVSFQVTQDKCDVLDKYSITDVVKVQFNLRGIEWNSPNGIKYFNTLEAWRIEGISQFENKPEPNIQAENHSVSNQDNDDLPF